MFTFPGPAAALPVESSLGEEAEWSSVVDETVEFVTLDPEEICLLEDEDEDFELPDLTTVEELVEETIE